MEDADAIDPAVTTPPPLTYPLPTERLRNAAMRLAAELDDAHLYRAAAYASMAVDAINQSRGEPQPDGDMQTDVDLDFELDEQGRVWMIREGDCHIIGRTDAVCAGDPQGEGVHTAVGAARAGKLGAAFGTSWLDAVIIQNESSDRSLRSAFCGLEA